MDMLYAHSDVKAASVLWFNVATAIPFWPFYVPVLLSGGDPADALRAPKNATVAQDEMAVAIRQVDTELETALNSLDGWAEGVLAREKNRIGELRMALIAQSERIREMDRLLSGPEHPAEFVPGPPADASLSPAAAERLQHSQQVRRQNLERLQRVRQRAYEDLMGTLAWLRELVSMIYLAKFTGAPASRAEELVAQIAAAVEGLSELISLDETTVAAGDST
jgi:hypothetical protein